MTSADFSPQALLRLSVFFFLLDVSETSPGKSDNLPLIYLPHLHDRIRAVLDFALRCKLFRPTMPCMWFLFVRPRVCLRLPSDSASQRTSLPSANSSYCQACSGLSPPSYRPCRAHNVKKQPMILVITGCFFTLLYVLSRELLAHHELHTNDLSVCNNIRSL